MRTASATRFILFVFLALISFHTIAHAGSIIGKVTGPGSPPAPNVCVNAYDPAQDIGFGAITDSLGNYAITGISAGNYRIQTDASCSAPSFFVDQWWNGETGTSNWYDEPAPLVPVGQNATISGIDFSLERGGILRGYVKDDAGQPIPSMCVIAQDVNCGGGMWYGQGQTDSTGYFSFTVPPGVYYIRADSHCAQLNYVTKFWDGGSGTIDCSQASAITVEAEQTTELPDMHLPVGGTVTGRVTAANGQPIANVCVNATNSICGGNSWFVGTQSDSEGRYAIERVPNIPVFIATNANCAGTQALIDEWWNGTEGVADCSQAVPVSVDSGHTLTNVDISLEPGVVISGNVSTVDLQPVEGFIISFFRGLGGTDHYNGTNTDGSGNYSIIVPPGTYYVYAHTEDPSLPYFDQWWNNGQETTDGTLRPRWWRSWDTMSRT